MDRIISGPHAGTIRPHTATYDGTGYTDAELIWLKAIDQYKRLHHRPNPSYAEVLRVAHALGYRRVAEPLPRCGRRG